MSQTYLASNWGSVSQAVKFPPKWFDFFKAMRYPKNFRFSRLITPARFTPSTPQKDLHGKIFALLDRFPQFWDFALCKEVQAQQRVFLYRVRAIKKNTGRPTGLSSTDQIKELWNGCFPRRSDSINGHGAWLPLTKWI